MKDRPQKLKMKSKKWLSCSLQSPAEKIPNIEEFNSKLRAYNKSELKIPKIRCLYTFIARYKARKYGQTNMNLGELSNWCSTNSRVPDITRSTFCS